MDILLTTTDMLQYYASENLFLPLNEVLPDDLYQQLEKQNRILTAYTSEQSAFAAGILLDSSTLSELAAFEPDSALAICTTENHPETIIAFIRYAMGW